MYNVRNDDRKFSLIAEYERTLQDLHNVARESMQARQAAGAANIMIRRQLMMSYKWLNLCMFLLHVTSQRNLI